jgi:hypothetical protein
MSSFDKCIDEQGPIISTIVFAVLFLVSEFLPYIKSLEGNGIVDEIVKIVSPRIRPPVIELNDEEPQNLV